MKQLNCMKSDGDDDNKNVIGARWTLSHFIYSFPTNKQQYKQNQ